jgi:hypothetical protein
VAAILIFAFFQLTLHDWVQIYCPLIEKHS